MRVGARSEALSCDIKQTEEYLGQSSCACGVRMQTGHLSLGAPLEPALDSITIR